MILSHLQLTHAPTDFSPFFPFSHFYFPQITPPPNYIHQVIVSEITILKQFIMGLVINAMNRDNGGCWPIEGTGVITQSLKAESPAGDSGRAAVDHWRQEQSHEMWGLLLNRRHWNSLKGHELSVTGRAQESIGCSIVDDTVKKAPWRAGQVFHKDDSLQF